MARGLVIVNTMLYVVPDDDRDKSFASEQIIQVEKLKLEVKT